MPTLPDLQAAFRAALLEARDGDPAGPLGAEIRGDGLSPEARLAVYRHHVLTTLAAVLKDAYPVVARLVGDGFFAFAADAFVRGHPPDTPCLFEYGAGFATFLAGFPPCRELVYLPDVARVEWAMHAAAHAPDAEAVDPGRLREVPAEATGGLVLRLHPSLALVSSPWPVDRIWRANQPGADAEVDLAAGAARVEVRRLGDDVVWRSLPAAEHAFRAALAGGAALAPAAEAALAVDGTFDLAAALGALFTEQLVVGFEAAA
jgi:hypothetical protein